MIPSLNAQWAGQAVASLLSRNIKDFYLSPGARSAPLALAVAEARARGACSAFTHFDERGLAFAALGTARARRHPVVCITTSGSAVAHLLPACIEAFQSGVPLVFLTADRPPEARGTGANQTILQPGIFGSHVVAAADFPAPSAGLLSQLDGWIGKLLRPTLAPWPGPVHLNLPFREPLLPGAGHALPEASFFQSTPESGTSLSIDEAPHGSTMDSALAWVRRKSCGLIVVGEIPPHNQCVWSEILALSGHLGWPVAADALSGGKGLPRVIQHLDFLLQSTSLPRPECILHLGGRLVQRRVQELLATFDGADLLQIRPGPEHLRTPDQHPLFLSCDPADFCRAVTQQIPAAWSDFWRLRWEQLDAKLETKLTEVLDAESELFHLSEPGLARWTARCAQQKNATLFLGNSMPIRDFDSMTGPSPGEALRVLGQRGASGIDGNIAHIAGYARATGDRVIGLIGDLAALHDLNSMALLRGLPVTLIIPNNYGGGIFEFLPLDLSQTIREEFLETPHSLSFSGACAQFGISYVCTNSAEVIDAAMRNQHGPVLIEVPSDRSRNLQKHREITHFVLDELGK